MVSSTAPAFASPVSCVSGFCSGTSAAAGSAVTGAACRNKMRNTHTSKELKYRITPHVNFFQKDTEEKVKFNRKRRDGDQDQVGKCKCMYVYVCVRVCVCARVCLFARVSHVKVHGTKVCASELYVSEVLCERVCVCVSGLCVSELCVSEVLCE